MRGIHHSAIVTSDVERSKRFWCGGLGFAELFDQEFTGDWPTLFEANTDRLRSVFLGDPDYPETGIVELVAFDGAPETAPAAGTARTPSSTPGPPPPGPRVGFFLLSLQRDVEEALAALAELGFTDGVRRISMPAPGGQSVAMAVIAAPDGVLVELVGPPQ